MENFFKLHPTSPLKDHTENTLQTATNHTKKLNEKLKQNLPFEKTFDFSDVEKGLIGKPKELVIYNDQGQIIWNMQQYETFEKANESPDTVNPSLWRIAQLNKAYGLFKVTDRVYQVRGYDLSVMSIIKSNTGYIIVDPLTCKETAKAAIDLVSEHLGKKDINAIIYTHSHVDHFGGVKGIISLQEIEAKKIPIIAPKGFMEEAISENVRAGNVMARRASYMYGNLLPINAIGQVDAGLGKAVASGETTLIPPNTIIDQTPTSMSIDGVDFVFQITPNTEAPAEMNFYLPQFKALCMAENATHTLHNLYTLRGAKVRDAQSWTYYLNESLNLFGKEAEVLFASHHWPTWGNKNISNYLKKQRDTYKYIHDQTLRLANQGYTPNDIAEMIQLPKSLANEWHNRDYYGSVSHNVKAVYQNYLGWFDGNPAHLHPLPLQDGSKKYVEYMGGADVILQKAQQDYAEGNYRWVAEVLNHLVFADPTHEAAKELLAKTYNQLGFQTENGPWRNFYLSGALELTHGVKEVNIAKSASPDLIKAMTLPMFYDFLAIHLNGQKAENRHIVLNWVFPNTHDKYVTTVENGVFNYQAGNVADAHATLTLNRHIFDSIMLNELTFETAIKEKRFSVVGQVEKLTELLELLDKFNFWFNIVTPQKNQLKNSHAEDAADHKKLQLKL